MVVGCGRLLMQWPVGWLRHLIGFRALPFTAGALFCFQGKYRTDEGRVKLKAGKLWGILWRGEMDDRGREGEAV